MPRILKHITLSSILPVLLVVFCSAKCASADTVFALAAGNRLIALDSDTSLATLNAPITGLLGGEELLGMDIRPKNGALMALSNLKRTFQITPDFPGNTAIATLVGGPFAYTPAGSKVGFDINPIVDRIRVTTDAEANFRLNPDTGDVTAVDTPLNPAGNIVDITYNRNYLGAVATTLYGIDSNSNTFVRIGGDNGFPSSNGGAVTTLGTVNMDFGQNSALESAGTELYAILDAGGETRFCRMVPETGFVFSYFPIAGNPAVLGMAVAPESITGLKLSIKMSFADLQKGLLNLKAKVPIPAGFDVEGKTITVDVGGHRRSYVVDEKGKAALGGDRVSFKVKSKNGVVESQLAKVAIKFVGNFTAELADEELVNADLNKAPAEVVVTIVYGGHTAQQTTQMLYTAKAGKTGKAKN